MDINMIRVRNVTDNSYCYLDINSILAVYYSSDFSTLLTHRGKYKLSITEAGLEEWEEEFGFMKSDRSNYINIAHIVKFHSRLNVVLFNNVASIKQARKLGYPEVFCHPSIIKRIAPHIGKINDLAYMMSPRPDNSFVFVKNYADEI